MPYKWWRLGAVAAFLLLDVSFAIYRRLFANECDRVSYTAHIAGAITGLLMGIVLLHNLQVDIAQYANELQLSGAEMGTHPHLRVFRRVRLNLYLDDNPRDLHHAVLSTDLGDDRLS